MGRSIALHAGQLLLLALVAGVSVATLASIQPRDLENPAALFDFLGRACGIVGLLTLLLAGALSARIPRFDAQFGGLTRLWRSHHVLGAISLLLLMAHPLLLALGAAEGDPAEALALLFPEAGLWALWSGWLALALMMIFLAPSFRFFGQPDYARWKRLHRLAGPAIGLALLHSAQYGRTLPGPLQNLLWWVLGLLTLAALVWHFALSRRLARYRYTVARVIMVANNVVELVLEPAGRRQLQYEAGQFVYLTPFDHELAAGHAEEHPYTLSSSPLESRLRIAIKDLGDASRAIQTIRPGSLVTVEGPFGRLFPPNARPSQLWIAGGIGITPFLARARYLQQLRQPVDVCLVYCVQDEARARFLDELRQIAATVPGFRVIPHYFYQQGPLDASFLDREVPGLSERALFVCGPEPLDRLAKRLARAAGVRRRDIHSEEFELL
ncbi:MAG: oxidoreductase [Gammaproteobacteria bacterium HGW-Gammaproteobacteria-8]|nr:MAG: oxidoreductase [Gammaproteobacteria bacterium HGW-Gammaproteobacteria-8]